LKEYPTNNRLRLYGHILRMNGESSKEGFEHERERKMAKRKTRIKMNSRLGKMSHQGKEENGTKLRRSCGKMER
jgi:hypothetical protein